MMRAEAVVCALARGTGRWNTADAPFVRKATGASALSPKITLELRFPDREPQIVRLGPGRTIVGRESGDILLHDREASALHAEIEFTKGHVIVRDLGSSNGTWREGKRLPQFALYEGQTFRCGTTDIKLVEIRGADAPAAGGTASGSDSPGPGASSTLPSAAIEVDDAPSSTATVPGEQSTSAAAPSSDPPGPTGPATLVGPAPAPPPPQPASGVPLAVPAAASAPVANAVIKLGDAQPRAVPRGSAPRDRSRLKKILVRSVLGIAGIGLLGALVFGIYSLIAGRDQAFVRELARELPRDTVGFVALASPERVTALVGDDVPPAIREQFIDEFGVDPLSPEALAEWGIASDKPLGVALLDGTGMVAVSVGVSDQDAFRSTLTTKVAEIIEADEDLRWIERSFGDTPGLWLDEPTAAAVLLRDKRAMIVTGGPTEDVAAHAKRLAEVKSGETLADTDGFEGLATVPGKVVTALYIDGPAGRSAIPGKGMSVMAARMAIADLDGYAMMLSEDDEKFHLSSQTVTREGASATALFEGVKRKTDLLDTIPGPALAGFDGVFAVEPIRQGMGLRGAFGLGLGAVEDEFREETGLDLQSDILNNLDGRYGMVLRALPQGPVGDDQPPAMIAWIGASDEAAAKQVADRFFAKMGDDLDMQLQTVAGTTVYTLDDGPGLSLFVHHSVVWLLIGPVDPAEIIDGKGEPFRKSPRIAAIREATRAGDQFAAFVDLKEIFAALHNADLPVTDEEWERWDPVISQLEAVTSRGELDDRTVVFRMTVHTSAENGLAALTQGLIEVVGEQLAEDLARRRREERCEKLIDHIVELMKAELAAAGAGDTLERPYDLLEECRGDETTDEEIDCMLEATSLQALTRCGPQGGDEGTPVDIGPEPKPVPYVDDIWPNREASGTDSGRPNPEVNYAVPLHEAPARGPRDALVTVVMFGDFQCPYSKRVLSTLDQLMATDPEVRVVFRHMPLPMHPQAKNAARAAIAANAQGKFWEMHNKLFDNQTGLSDDVYTLWAAELGLDTAQFERDFHDGVSSATIATDNDTAKRFGVLSTPSFFINGRYLAGTHSLSTFTRLVDEEKRRAKLFVERRGNTRKRLYSDMIGHFAGEVVSAEPEPVPVPVAETRYTITTSDLPRRGAAGFVPVEIVECGDFDCPFCDRARATLDRILTEYEGKVALRWLHNPLSFHPGAEPAARAAVAAHNQGKFWEMHDKLFEDRKKRSDADFLGYAADLGLDTARFSADLSAPATASTVTEQQKRCTDNDGRGTPSFFINGRLLSGAQPYDAFEKIIEQELSGGI